MKKSEIDQAIRKHILPSYQHYYVDQHIMFMPFGNNYFIKGYLFYSKGDNETGLQVTYFVMPLFVKTDCIAISFGDYLNNVTKTGWFKKTESGCWDVTKGEQAKTFQKVCEAIGKQGEPILKKFQTAEDYYRLQKGERKDDIRVYESVTYSTILFGDESLQDKMLKGLVKAAGKERDYDWVRVLIADAHLMLGMNTKKERTRLLNLWSNETMGHLKLPHLKPFVVE